MEPRNFYVIRSHLSEQVLTVDGDSSSPGTRVITWPMKNWGEWINQLWYDDPMTGTIKSKQTGYCLDISDGRAVVNPHYPGSVNQLWERSGEMIRNRSDLHKVIDIAGEDKSYGAKVIAYADHGGTNQKFDFLEVPGLRKPYSRREFYIVSEMNNKVLDISGGNPGAGAWVIVWPKTSPPSKNQLWYFDFDGIIHSALNDLVIESQSGTQVKTAHLRHNNSQQWTVVGNRIVSKTGECLDIKGEDKKDGAEVISYGYKGSSNQHWRLEFV